jgi:general secretion pathway protein G
MAKKTNIGFTMIELVVVIAVIAILAGITTVVVNQVLDDARRSRAASEVKVLGEAILNVYKDTTIWPLSNPMNTVDLWNNPQNGLFRTNTGAVHAHYPARAWKGPYLNKLVTLDPWGTSYHYRANTVGTQTFRGVACAGLNKQVNTPFTSLTLAATNDDFVFFIQ